MQCYSQLWAWQTALKAAVRAELRRGWAAAAPVAVCQGSAAGKGRMTLIHVLKTFTVTLPPPAQRIQNVLHRVIK